MDVKYLNTALLQQLETPPDAAARCNQCFDGTAGEGYLLQYGDELVLAERKIGDPDCRITRFTPPEPNVLETKRDGGRFVFTLSGAGGTFRAVAMFAEADAAEKMLAGRTQTGDSAAPVPESAALFAAGMLFAAKADGDIPEEEREMLGRLLPAPVLAEGWRYLREHDAAFFAAEANEKCSAEQKFSLFANQLELMMCDGELRSSEMAFLKQEAAAFGIPLEEYRKLRDLLVLKNQFPVLFEF